MRKSLSNEEKRNICDNCAKKLKMIRMYLGWKQRDLAEVVGTTHRRISEIENGKVKMPWTLFLALYMVFSLNPDARTSSFYSLIGNNDILSYLSGGSHKCDVLLSKIEESERESYFKMN